MKQTLNVNGRMIGDGYPAYIIAEMSANHAGSLERAKEIIHAAKAAGADCIKIQTYTPDTLTIDCSNEYFQVQNGTWEGENLYHLYGKAYTPWEWQPELMEEAKKTGIDFLSTPFDRTAVDFLEEMGIQFYKIASFEMIDLPLLRYVASKGKPIIMSTGMSTLEEIREAVETICAAGNEQLAILKCSSAYPAKTDDMHLKTITDLKERFQIPVGLSDHSMGSLSAMTAVALGANVIEKHFCLGREIENPDASFSMTPEEFASMVRDIRDTEAALGVPTYGVSEQEKSSVVFRRSIFAVQDIEAGQSFDESNTRIIRPGYGMKPKYIEDLLTMRPAHKITRGMPIHFEDVQKGAVLLLTNNANSEGVFQFLKKTEPLVYRIENKLTSEMIAALAPSFVVSYNYRFLVPADVIEYMNGRMINLHTSYLPYNRGSAPNFFSFYENTPKGVSIHQMSTGLDQGALLWQKELFFDETTETFATTYDKLNEELTKGFCENWNLIRSGQCPAIEQIGPGTYHTMKELNAIREQHPFTWNDTIADCLARIEE